MNFLFRQLIKNSLIFLRLSLSHSLISPVFFLLNIFPVTLSSLSLKQTSLPPPISSRRLTPHAADCHQTLAHRSRRSEAHRSRRSEAHRRSSIASSHAADRLLIKPPRRRSPHLTLPIVCSSSRRSETHGACRRAACL